MTNEPGTILWASLIASALVSAIVALLVEYLAKPQLEARKEQILERLRARRQLASRLSEVSFRCGQIMYYRSVDLDSQPAMMVEQLRVNCQQVYDSTIEMSRTLPQLDDDVEDYLIRTAAAIATHTLILAKGERVPDPGWHVFDKMTDALGPIGTAVLLPRWRIRRKKHLLSKVGT